MNSRSFCWIDDAVSSTCALMEACGVESGMVVNVGNPHGEIAMCEVYERLFDLCGWRPEHVVYREADRDSAKRRCPDTQRLESLIAGIRYLPLDEGLKRTAEWYLGFAS